MASLLQFEPPAAKRLAKLAARIEEDRLSHPEITGIITPRWSCSEHKERLDQIATVVSRMQGCMNEAAIIEASSNEKPVGRKEVVRFMKLKDSLETYVNLFEDTELPDSARSQSEGC
jgi:hypothetical protein